MFKKWVLAFAPLVMMAGSAFAADDVLDQFSGIDANTISDATVDLGENLLDDNDTQSAGNNTAGDDQVDAIESAYRSYHSSCGSYAYRSYGHYNYHGYRYQPYNYCYSVYRPVYYCNPVVYSTCYTPCYTSYWGCY